CGITRNSPTDSLGALARRPRLVRPHLQGKALRPNPLGIRGICTENWPMNNFAPSLTARQYGFHGTYARSSKQEPVPSPDEPTDLLMPAFFDPTLAQTVGGGFIQEDKIDEALRQLIGRPHISKGRFSYPSQAELRDLTWNHMDQNHRPFIHRTYGD